MPLFPIFVDLSNATALVVGEGAEAERKRGGSALSLSAGV